MGGGITVSNGLTWSPDDLTMYFADSHVRTIFSFDFDTDSGTPRNQRVFAELASHEGVPDGATVDAEGFLWSAKFDGWCITRFAPEGAWIESFGCPFSVQPVVSSVEIPWTFST